MEKIFLACSHSSEEVRVAGMQTLVECGVWHYD
jgi:hypothetical protein